jgi:hypothetical protein
MSSSAPEVEVQANQRKKAKRATLEMLRSKKPSREDFTLPFGPDGERVSFLFVAIGSAEYDELLTEHPPTNEQRANQSTFNITSFAPALLARVCREPAVSVGDWTELFKSENWGRGELMTLFFKASRLCVQESDPLPTDAG